MKMDRQIGGTPVGYLSDLDPVSARAVMYLRLWSDEAEDQARIRSDLACQLGTERGRHAMAAFESLCDLCARHGRRPLMRHSETCKCLGADESCFATFIGYASEGRREDAALMAMTLVRPDMAMCLAGLAEEFGLALRQMSHSPFPRLPRDKPGARKLSKTLH